MWKKASKLALNAVFNVKNTIYCQFIILNIKQIKGLKWGENKSTKNVCENGSLTPYASPLGE